jgi:hypothetical protein
MQLLNSVADTELEVEEDCIRPANIKQRLERGLCRRGLNRPASPSCDRCDECADPFVIVQNKKMYVRL